MDRVGTDPATASQRENAGASEHARAAGEATPFLTLDGFSGPLDHLLTLARAQKIDLSRLSLTSLVDQLGVALRQTSAKIPLGRQGDWVVMAAWLVQLRARLLLPADPAEGQAATADAAALRGRLMALDAAQALAGWLERRPQLGRDGFVRGRAEVLGLSVDAAQAIDAVEFLWASLALFDDAEVADTAPVYRPLTFHLHTVAAARERILRRLAAAPDGVWLDRLLPDPEAASPSPHVRLRQRSALASTLVASLELTKQGAVVLGQAEAFQAIHVARA